MPLSCRQGCGIVMLKTSLDVTTGSVRRSIQVKVYCAAPEVGSHHGHRLPAFRREHYADGLSTLPRVAYALGEKSKAQLS